MKLTSGASVGWRPRLRLGAFTACASGSIAIIFAVVLPVLLGAAGAAIDYGRLHRARAQMQATLDNAVLAAIQNDTEAKAKQVFDDYIAAHPLPGVPASAVSAKVKSYAGISMTADARFELATTFSGLFGIDTMNAHVTSGVEKAWYQELYFAIDLSSSTGMGATPADRDALEELTRPYTPAFYGTKLPQGCAFGCHRREGWEPDGKTVYQMAREAGIKLREDELNSQFSGLVDLLLDPSDELVQNGMRKMSVIGFSDYAKQLIAPSRDAAEVKAALASFPDADRFQTIYSNLFAKMDDLLDDQGKGTAGDPRKMIILITDGIESRDAFYAQKALDVTQCETIKAKGFRLAVVEIKYPKLTMNALYDDTVLPVENDISPALAACASSGWYFQALNNTDVPVKFGELKKKISAVGIRLTN